MNGVVSVTVREINFSSKSHFDNKNGFYSHMKDCVIYHISENSGKIRNQKNNYSELKYRYYQIVIFFRKNYYEQAIDPELSFYLSVLYIQLDLHVSSSF